MAEVPWFDYIIGRVLPVIAVSLKCVYNSPNLWFLTHFWGIIMRFSQIIFLTLDQKIKSIAMIIERKSE